MSSLIDRYFQISISLDCWLKLVISITMLSFRLSKFRVIIVELMIKVKNQIRRGDVIYLR